MEDENRVQTGAETEPMTYRQRIRKAWEQFQDKEAELYREAKELIPMMEVELETIPSPVQNFVTNHNENLYNILDEVFEPAKQDRGVVLGQDKDAGKVALCFQTGMSDEWVHLLGSLIRSAPEELKEHWDFQVGFPETENTKIEIRDRNITAQDVQCWTEWEQGMQTAAVAFFCPDVENPTDEEKEQMIVLLVETLGELTVLRSLNGIKVLDQPMESPADTTMAGLAAWMKERGIQTGITLEQYMDQPLFFEREPDAQEVRNDVVFGTSRCPQLQAEYLEGRTETADWLAERGGTAGFIYMPAMQVRTRSDEMRLDRIMQETSGGIFRRAGYDGICWTGMAVGTQYMYLDVLIYDMEAFCAAVEDYFRNKPTKWVAYKPFRPEEPYRILHRAKPQGGKKKKKR